MKQWLLPGPQSRMFRAEGGGCLPATAANACPASTGIPGAQDPDRPELSSLEGLVPLSVPWSLRAIVFASLSGSTQFPPHSFFLN